MCASIFNLLPCYVRDCLSRCPVYVLLVFGEEVVNQLLHLLHVPIVDGCPCILYDLVDLSWVCCVSARLVWCVRVRWTLDGLHGLCVLLFDGSVDRCLAVGALEPPRRCLSSLLMKVLVLPLKPLLVLLMLPGELYL